MDLVFTNQPLDTHICKTLPVTYPEDRHHPTIEVEIYIPSCKPAPQLNIRKHRSRKLYCFARTNYTKLNDLLHNVNWNALTSGNNFDDIVSNFYKLLHSFISESTPQIISRNNKGPPWNNNFLIRAKNRKKQIL